MRRLQEAQNAAREQQGNDRSTVATRSVEGENVDDVEEGTYYDDEYEGFEPSYQGSGFVNEHDLANGLLEGLGSETGKVGLEEGARAPVERATALFHVRKRLTQKWIWTSEVRSPSRRPRSSSGSSTGAWTKS